MQSGVYWGYVSMIEGMVARIKAEFGAPMKVIATGGLAPLFADATDAIERVDQDLDHHRPGRAVLRRSPGAVELERTQPMPPQELVFLPLGGAGEIGLNLNLYGLDRQWLMVDLGISFADETLPGVDIILPGSELHRGKTPRPARLDPDPCA